MKTNESMTMSEMMNFDRDAVNYINDNLQYIVENAKADENDDYATEALEHYNATVDAFNANDEYLSDEQKERFLFVAKRLFTQGYIENAGVLK